MSSFPKAWRSSGRCSSSCTAAASSPATSARRGSPFYDNAMLAAAHADAVGANITYRPASQRPWPAGAEDVGAAVHWMRDHIAALGGDPKRIYLMGHSASAVHPTWHSQLPARRPHLGECHPRFGALRLRGDSARSPRARLLWRQGRQRRGLVTAGAACDARSTPARVRRTRPPPFVAQARRLNEALCTRQRCPKLVYLPGHSHISEMYPVNKCDTSPSAPVLAFVHAQR